ncbi:MAG: sigma-70 family RNA polymerase sigma factor [Desulfocapsaceae bacterium]|jgi:RNA polymerase sigma-70 factor (ECF subfamily)|nr:sigma-70 family RNA polymerase sigma factor [Desulfocapsaceae bacterium]
MERSDETLIKSIRDGDTDSFAVIVERYKFQIYNLMYRYSGSVEDASEMTQDVFCRVYERLGRYRNRSSFFAWLYTLALNHARDWVRKKNSSERNNSRFSRDYSNAEVRTPGAILEKGQRVAGLYSALDMLPEDRREMVLLRYRHERSIRELAEIFSISESAVKMRLQRALDELGKILKNNE